MALLLVAGTLREVWRETTLLNGGGTQSIPTGIRAGSSPASLARVLATISVEPVQGAPRLEGSVASVNGFAVVTINNTAAVGNSARFTLDITRLHSLQQGRQGTNSVVHSALEYSTSIFGSTVITPEMFGAVGNGLVDDTVALQAAANSLAATGGVIYLTRTYLISARIVSPPRIKWQGNAHQIITRDVPWSVVGSGACIISAQSADFSFLKLSDCCEVSDLNFGQANALVTPLAGIVIDFTGAYGVRLRRLSINCAFDGVADLNNSYIAQHCTIEDVDVTNFLGAAFRFKNVVDFAMEDCVAVNLVNAFNNVFQFKGVGILLEELCETANLRNVLAEETLHGIRLVGVAAGNRLVNNVNLIDCTMDLCDMSGLSVFYARHISVKGGWIGGTRHIGSYITNSLDIKVADVSIVANGSAGTVIENANTGSIDIHDNIYTANQSADGYDAAIYVGADASNFSLMNNRLALVDPAIGAPGTTPYLAHIAAGASDGYAVVCNRGLGTAGAPNVIDGGTGVNKYLAGNGA